MTRARSHDRPNKDGSAARRVIPADSGTAAHAD